VEEAAKDAAGDSPDAVQDVVERVKNAVSRVEKLTDVSNASGNQNVTTVQNSDNKTVVVVLIVGVAVVLGYSLSQSQTITQQSATINRLSSQMDEMRTRTEAKQDEMTRRLDRYQDYLNAIYAQAPHLKPADYGKTESKP